MSVVVEKIKNAVKIAEQYNLESVLNINYDSIEKRATIHLFDEDELYRCSEIFTKRPYADKYDHVFTIIDGVEVYTLVEKEGHKKAQTI